MSYLPAYILFIAAKLLTMPLAFEFMIRSNLKYPSCTDIELKIIDSRLKNEKQLMYYLEKCVVS